VSTPLFKVAWTTDEHVDTAGTHWYEAGELDAIAGFIEAQSPTAYISTGDLAFDAAPGQYAVWNAYQAQISAPFHCLAGNHDGGVANDYAAYIAAINSFRFSFVIQGVRFIGFHTTSQSGSTNGTITVEELAWFDAEAAAAAAAHERVIAMTHHPPFDFGGYTCERGANIRAICEARGVKMLWYGHIHNTPNARQIGAENCVYVDGGSLSWLAANNTKGGLMLVTIYVDRAEFDWRDRDTPFGSYAAGTTPAYTKMVVYF
jgi:3',5'-cyclic AMP phosphodiesterase CpdA